MITNYAYRPGKYFISTFISTYIFWFIGAYVNSRQDLKFLYIFFMLPGLLAPFIISIIFVFRSGCNELKKDFLNRLFNPAIIQLKTLPVFFLLMPLAVLTSIAISIPFGGSISQFSFANEFSFSTGIIPVLFVLILAASFEELGWRGYAFDSLSSKFNYFKASLIFSILWSLWHFPLVFVEKSYQYEIFQENFIYGINFFVSIIPMGIIISWICIKNRKSIPAAILFHFIVNISQEILSMTQSTKCVETVVLSIAAAVIVFFDRKMFFKKIQ